MADRRMIHRKAAVSSDLAALRAAQGADGRRMTPRPPDLRDEVLDRMRARGADRMHAPRDIALLRAPYLDVGAVHRCFLDLVDARVVTGLSGFRVRLAPQWRDGEQLEIDTTGRRG